MKLIDAVNDLNARIVDQSDTFGIELAICALGERHYNGSSARKIFFRPAQEPLLTSIWPLLMKDIFSKSEALEMVQLLACAPVDFRTAPMRGVSPDGVVFNFASDVPANWLDQLLVFDMDTTLSAVELAARYFFHVVWFHPFTDGNGRFARAMIYRALSRRGLVETPCLGLGGALYFVADGMAQSVQECSRTGCYKGIETQIDEMICISHRVLSTKHHSRL